MKISKKEAISPDEIMNNLEEIIPEAVIQAVNDLLKEKYRGSEASITINELITRICKIDNSLNEHIIYKNKYLDFESIFRQKGWNVVFNSPCRDENFKPYFIFSKK